MATKNTYRLIVCVDIDSENLSEAYGRLQTCMKAGMAASEPGIAWETSDEWYGEDEYGEAGDPNELQAAIMTQLDKAKAKSENEQMLEMLTEERDGLLAVFDAMGGRGVEIAERIDALQEEIDQLEDSLKK